MKLNKFKDIFPSKFLLESYVKYDYGTIIVEVKSKNEVKDLENKLVKIYKSVNYLSDSIDVFPNYIFIEPNKFNLSKDADIVFLSTKPDEYIKQQYIYSNKNIDQHIYEMTEWRLIEQILRYGSLKPNYAPKKFNRTLESIKWYPYRFKTEEEFIKEYGDEWYDSNEPNWAILEDYDEDDNYNMNHLFGKEYPFMEDELDKNKKYPRRDRLRDENGFEWLIGWWMLTKNKPKVPSYKSKGKRILESLINTNYITFVLYNLEEYKKIQEKLFSIDITWNDGEKIVYEDHGDFPFYVFINKIEKNFFYRTNERITNNSIIDTIVGVFNLQPSEVDDKVYTLSEFDRVFNIRPNYNPKKFNRTLEYNSFIESLNESIDDMVYVYVYCDNREKSIQFEDFLHKNGYFWEGGSSYIIRDTPVYNRISYIINKITKRLSGYMDKRTYKNLFLYPQDFDKIKSNMGIILKPNYKPKKIDRTLESIKWYPYRFKTEEEMYKEFGDNWQSVVFYRLGWNQRMEKLYGKDYPYTEDEVDVNLIHIRYGVSVPREDTYNSLYIPWSFLTKNKPTTPNYKPRKIDRTLESVETPNSEEQIKKILKDYPYNVLILYNNGMSYDTEELYRISQKYKPFLNLGNNFYSLQRDKCIVVILKKIGTDSSSPIIFSDHNVEMNYYTSGAFKGNYPDLEAKVVDLNNFDLELDNIFFQKPKPNYKPRKIDREI